jgi:hypothetical protein
MRPWEAGILLVVTVLIVGLALGDEKRPKPTPAEAAAVCHAASDCKGMLPHLCKTCDDGKEHCAHWSCASGRCETEVCPAAPAAAQCHAASDCKGMLPKICKTCDDGKDHCAHWSCAAGACEVEVCP